MFELNGASLRSVQFKMSEDCKVKVLDLRLACSVALILMSTCICVLSSFSLSSNWDLERGYMSQDDR